MHVISSYLHLDAYRYFICFTHYKRTILYLNKFINVIYSLHLLHTLSINSFEHSFLLEMIHFKCYLFYLFFSNSFVIYSSIHNKRKFQVRDHPFKTSACLRGGGVSPIADVCRLEGGRGFRNADVCKLKKKKKLHFVL